MGHWYSRDGTPTYTVPYADPSKGCRDTTLGDAKKLGLVPSVTTILDVPDKPALLRWKTEQLLKAAYAEGNTKSYASFTSICASEADKIGRESAARGQIIHDQLEQVYSRGGEQGYTSDDPFIAPIIKFMNEKFPGVEWISEESFTSITNSYGGRIDLYSPSGIVLDFKTKATSDIKKMVAYAGHHMQTAAYAMGLSENDRFSTLGCCSGLPLKNVQRFNLFISTEQPGLLNLTESTNFERDWEMFSCLNRYWQLVNNYTPLSL